MSNTLSAAPEIDSFSSDPERLAEIRVLTPVSIVVPTYRESESLPHLLERIEALRIDHDLTLELLVMDDNSADGSVELIRESGHDWARIVVRDGPRGLSPAVLDGIKLARYPVVVVMDADLSHPPEKIPDMILALASGQQFVIGSRYVPGGSTDDHWGFFRWLNSRVATLLASPLTDARDPMAGFFAFRRHELDRALYLNPVGYKIGLELIVKCGLENVGEVPIAFTDRRFGQSKLSFKEQLRYLQHLRRLYTYKFAYVSQAVRFALVGLFGVCVNLAVLSILVALGVPVAPSVMVAISISLVTNFLLHRLLPSAPSDEWPVRNPFQRFALASAAGATLNFALTMIVATRWPGLAIQAAATCGIAGGMVLNFLASQFLAFRRRMGQG
ncbi:glycosyltransferase [Tundrisphaera lichenicola]|uniref:glycosyltransferase n=1 Tax=Tundrisphaera lichenicola TaxID=2029860 RepID=UPI003EC09EF8